MPAPGLRLSPRHQGFSLTGRETPRIFRATLRPCSGEKVETLAKKHYDCSKCPSYCCSYPRIQLENGDLERLAAHFEMTRKRARKRFTRKDKSEAKNGKAPRILRHKEDEIFGTICTFFDHDNRGCGIYEARPQACRDYPGRKRCGYYEFLSFERDAQRDPDYIAVTGN